MDIEPAGNAFHCQQTGGSEVMNAEFNKRIIVETHTYAVYRTRRELTTSVTVGGHSSSQASLISEGKGGRCWANGNGLLNPPDS